MTSSNLLNKLMESGDERLDKDAFRRILEAQFASTSHTSAMSSTGPPTNIVAKMIPISDMFAGMSYVAATLLDTKFWLYTAFGMLAGLMLSCGLYCYFKCSTLKGKRKQKAPHTTKPSKMTF